MRMYVRVCMHMHTHARTHARKHARMHVHACVHTCTRTRAHIYVKFTRVQLLVVLHQPLYESYLSCNGYVPIRQLRDNWEEPPESGTIDISDLSVVSLQQGSANKRHGDRHARPTRGTDRQP